MEDPLRAAEGDGHRQARAADGEQPAGARVRAPQARDREHADPRRDGHAEQPAGLASERLVEQPQRARLAAEHAAAAAAARPDAAARPAVLAEQPAEAVVAEDQRPDAVVARPRHPRAVGGRGQPDQQRPGEAYGHHRRPARGQAARRGGTPARRDPQPGDRESRHHEQRRGHLRLEAEADAHATQHDPPRPPVLEPAHDEPQRGGAAERQQRVGVVVARDRHGHRRQHQRQAGDEAGRAPEPAPRHVIGQRDGADAHQRLRHQHAPRAEAEHARGQRLHPQRERRLVHRHHSRRVERAVEERVPAGGHGAHCSAVVLVGEAVAIERPQVEHAGRHQQHGELGTREGDGQRPRAVAGGGERERGGRHGDHLRARGREPPVTPLGVR